MQMLGDIFGEVTRVQVWIECATSASKDDVKKVFGGNDNLSAVFLDSLLAIQIEQLNQLLEACCRSGHGLKEFVQDHFSFINASNSKCIDFISATRFELKAS